MSTIVTGVPKMLNPSLTDHCLSGLLADSIAAIVAALRDNQNSLAGELHRRQPLNGSGYTIAGSVDASTVSSCFVLAFNHAVAVARAQGFAVSARARPDIRSPFAKSCW